MLSVGFSKIAITPPLGALCALGLDDEAWDAAATQLSDQSLRHGMPLLRQRKKQSPQLLVGVVGLKQRPRTSSGLWWSR